MLRIEEALGDAARYAGDLAFPRFAVEAEVALAEFRTCLRRCPTRSGLTRSGGPRHHGPGQAGRGRAGSSRRKPAVGRRAAGAPARARDRDACGDASLQPAIEPIRQSIAESAEHQSEQRLGFTARRAAILAAVVCVLTLTIAGPVRTYFAQRTEMNSWPPPSPQLRAQIADLEQQKGKLADPVYIAAQARERLGFVMPGDIPYQVQLPAGCGGARGAAGTRRRPRTATTPGTPRCGTPSPTRRTGTAARSPAHRYPALPAPAADPPAGPPPAPGAARWLMLPTWKPSRASWAGNRAVCWRSPTAAPTVNPAW